MQDNNQNTKAVAVWLFFCCFMVFAMATIGAITRLTESGLSITEWKPVSGALPPLSHAAWQHQFDLYRQSPEFAAKHFWMSLDDFKQIFFWEWLHRFWGRAIGIVYAVPLLWFALRRKIPAGYGWKLAAVLGLGVLQGFVGWFMVKSGLVDRPSVSHFRLATHLALALLLFSVMLWLGLSLWRKAEARSLTIGPPCFGWAVLAMVTLTIIWGAFVAGLKAGLIYNEFPHMGDGFVPDDFGSPLTSPAGVQFIHRWLAIATACCVLAYAWMTRRSNGLAPFLALAVVIQVGLGLSTLLLQVPIVLAALHQAGAITVLGFMVASQRVMGDRVSTSP